MSATENNKRKDIFIANLNAHTKLISDVKVVRLHTKDGDELIYQNIAGQSGTFRILANLVENGRLTSEACNKALLIYGPYVEEAVANPGMHPAIDAIMSVDDGEYLRVDIEYIN
mgnify:CR=1 FL=1